MERLVGQNCPLDMAQGPDCFALMTLRAEQESSPEGCITHESPWLSNTQLLHPH